MPSNDQELKLTAAHAALADLNVELEEAIKDAPRIKIAGIPAKDFQEHIRTILATPSASAAVTEPEDLPRLRRALDSSNNFNKFLAQELDELRRENAALSEQIAAEASKNTRASSPLSADEITKACGTARGFADKKDIEIADSYITTGHLLMALEFLHNSSCERSPFYVHHYKAEIDALLWRAEMFGVDA